MEIDPVNIINLLIETYSYNSSSRVTPSNAREIELAQNIIHLINIYRQVPFLDIETEQKLIFDDITEETECAFSNPEYEQELDYSTTSAVSIDDNQERRE